MVQNSEKDLMSRRRAWRECALFLGKVFQKLSEISCSVDRYQIDGSLASGTGVGPIYNDVDVLLFLSPHLEIEEGLVKRMATALGSDHYSILDSFRFGQQVRSAHIKVPATPEIQTFKVLDLWIVHAPFVTMSPYWSKLFSSEEVQWQQEVRKTVQSHLSHSEYQILKATQLCEARWRYCASYALPLINDLDPRCRLILEELPIKESPGPLVQGFIKQWASGILNDSSCIRPLSQLPETIAKPLRQVGMYQREPPPAPIWTVIANRIQEQQTEKFYR